VSCLLLNSLFDFVPINAAWCAGGTAGHPFGEDHDPVAQYRRGCLAVFHAPFSMLDGWTSETGTHDIGGWSAAN
jgi:hypothetical protein